MKHRSFPAARAGFALLACVALRLTAQTITATGLYLPGMNQLDATITALMAKHGSPGAQLAVTRNGRLVLARGYGFADREASVAAQPDSVFRIASNSKLIIALAILTLVEQGRLDVSPASGASGLGVVEVYEVP